MEGETTDRKGLGHGVPTRHQTKYLLLVTDQVLPSLIAEWMLDLAFRGYYDRRISRRQKKAR